MNPRYSQVASRAKHRCEYCGAPEAIFNFTFEVEHIAPRARQGAADFENSALACRACNLFKADHVDAVDPATGASVRLFHPRQDRWSEHFKAQESGIIAELTSVGRATIDLLRMNADSQVTARQLWTRLGIYPP